MPRHVYVLGCDRFERARMQRVRRARDGVVHELASYQDAKTGPLHGEALLQRARAVLDAATDPVDAILGWWDFPVSTMLPILRREYGTPGASLESTLRCEHKYWSRLEQARCVPEVVPAFERFDPDARDPFATLTLPLPVWIKPVKSVASHLGFRIDTRADFARALRRIRAEIGRLAAPFDELLAYAHLPAEVAPIGGRHCIAEAIISHGHQVTVEGYVHDGRTYAYGIVDSLREGRHGSSFGRYQYPARVPEAVARSMHDVLARLLAHVGYGPGPFNAEFFWDEDGGLRLLEVNARISKSHGALFEMVDGESHHAVNLRCALGEAPDPPHRRGRCAVAAKFMVRRYQDAIVRHVPGPDELRALQRAHPGTLVKVHVRPGMRLSDLEGQDSYSYEVAELHMGARDEATLLADYRHALTLLGFAFEEREAA
jgi:biotin carboxylase